MYLALVKSGVPIASESRFCAQCIEHRKDVNKNSRSHTTRSKTAAHAQPRDNGGSVSSQYGSSSSKTAPYPRISTTKHGDLHTANSIRSSTKSPQSLEALPSLNQVNPEYGVLPTRPTRSQLTSFSTTYQGTLEENLSSYNPPKRQRLSPHQGLPFHLSHNDDVFSVGHPINPTADNRQYADPKVTTTPPSISPFTSPIERELSGLFFALSLGAEAKINRDLALTPSKRTNGNLTIKSATENSSRPSPYPLAPAITTTPSLDHSSANPSLQPLSRPLSLVLSQAQFSQF
ncbi:hypothetical protein QBC36DRAFT_363358 [Triangularia setosa]|uniref:Uncharacterized protein n=1 Tax=Triangularia setosa TaxID=2587417 RepID=A0AAN7A310_9PEZI|nr:hypothetical protein QBC36DRAFT_363358 [Podospora setosa]